MERQTRLLLVEDETSLRTLVAQYLGEVGYRVVEAVDGLDAVEQFQTAGPFDLILLDLNLPGLSGVDVCRSIRRIAPHQPVLIVSGAILPDHDRALEELGVPDQLTKPYHPEALRARIEQLVGRHRSRGGRTLAMSRSVE